MRSRRSAGMVFITLSTPYLSVTSLCLMRIRSVIAFVLLVICFQLLLTDVFRELKQTVIVALNASQTLLAAASHATLVIPAVSMSAN